MTSRCPSIVRRVLSRMFAIMLFTAALPAVAAAQNGTVTGTVTNAATNAPIPSRVLRFCNSTVSGNLCSTASTDSSGNYSISLAPGNYVAYTDGLTGVVNEIYGDVPCPAICNFNLALATGTSIAVPAGGTVSGRNFALAPAVALTGRVTDAVTGAGVQNVSVQLRSLIAGTNQGIATLATDATGAFSFQGIGAGTYYASATGTVAGYTSEYYDDILCPGVCNATTTVNSGTPIVVPATGAPPVLAIALAPGATISGSVRDNSAAPLAGVTVLAYARVGQINTLFGSATTNGSGAYTIRGLPPGTYRLYTSGAPAINEIYDNIPCVGACASADALSTGSPVSVAGGATASGIDFALDPGGAISGTVQAQGSSTVLSSVTVQVYRQTGPASVAFVAQATTDGTGAYTVRGIPTGSYFAVAFPNSAYIAEAFGGQPCTSCSSDVIVASTPIAVTAGATTTGRNFALDPAGAITGTITNSGGVPVTSASIIVVSGGATPRQVASGFTNFNGTYSVVGLPQGSYYLYTTSGQFANQAYNNVACPNGSCSAAFAVANGAAVSVTGGGTTANINFTLAPLQGVPGAPIGFQAVSVGSTAVITWSQPSSGGAATSYVLEAGLSPGTTIGSLPVGIASIVIPGVGPGTYYLRVRGVNAAGTGSASGEATLVVGNGGAGTPNAPTGLVAWMASGRLVMTWNAPAAGPVPTGYILEAGSAVGQSNLAAVPVTGQSFTFDPIPSGFFFLRVRAVANGVAGPASTDVMINVGNVAAPPSPPQSFNISRSGSTITLSWLAPAVGTATSYVIEAGSAAGLSNIGVVDTGTTATTLTVPGVPPGTYFLRVRAVNAQGTGLESNERSITVP